jgi:hypothetical protein
MSDSYEVLNNLLETKIHMYHSIFPSHNFSLIMDKYPYVSLFIYGLFNNTVTQYIALNGTTTSEWGLVKLWKEKAMG